MGIFRKKQPTGLKSWHVVLIVLIILVTISLRFYSYHWPSANIELKGNQLKVLVADTHEHLIKGLSEREEWDEYSGMLFIFKDIGQHTMVMRNMNFPLDIVWLKTVFSEKECSLSEFSLRKLMTGIYKTCEAEVVDIAPGLQPESIESLTPYFNRDQSDLVLELPSGWVKEKDLKIGDKLKVLD